MSAEGSISTNKLIGILVGAMLAVNGASVGANHLASSDQGFDAVKLAEVDAHLQGLREEVSRLAESLQSDASTRIEHERQIEHKISQLGERIAVLEAAQGLRRGGD